MGTTIAAFWQKGNYWLAYSRLSRAAFEACILLGVAAGAFSCGRLSVLEERSVPVAIGSMLSEERNIRLASSSSAIFIGESEEGRVDASNTGAVVASKNSDRYHLPWCGGAQTIKEENKIWFSSESEAIAAGYTKAGNCR